MSAIISRPSHIYCEKRGFVPARDVVARPIIGRKPKRFDKDLPFQGSNAVIDRLSVMLIFWNLFATNEFDFLEPPR